MRELSCQIQSYTIAEIQSEAPDEQKPSQEIQIIRAYLISLANYPKKKLSIRARDRFSKEINRCRYWLLIHDTKQTI